MPDEMGGVPVGIEMSLSDWGGGVWSVGLTDCGIKARSTGYLVLVAYGQFNDGILQPLPRFVQAKLK